MRYAVVIEQAEGNDSAYGPDLPGCVATGATVAEVDEAIREAVAFHIEGLREDGLSIPLPVSRVDYVDVAAWVADGCLKALPTGLRPPADLPSSSTAT